MTIAVALDPKLTLTKAQQIALQIGSKSLSSSMASSNSLSTSNSNAVFTDEIEIIDYPPQVSTFYCSFVIIEVSK